MSQNLKMKKLILMITAFVALTGVMNAQTIVKGNVKEKTANGNLDLPFANVFVEGTTIGAATDMDGNYELVIPDAGTFTVSFSFMGYKKQSKVIESTGNETLTFNIILEADGEQLQEVQVAAKINRESESMLLLEQKEAVLATQAIGAIELSRKGVGDAEGAVTKVSGISKQEGVKNVFVRGLGDRYNATTLNGFPLPSDDPEYKNISLDFFSTNVIQSVDVNKVFGANNVGDVGGAVINIRSKELMGDSELELSVSGGANSQTIGEDFLKSDGVGSFGYANNLEGPSEEVASTTYGFANKLDPGTQSFKFNKGLDVNGGSSILENGKLNFYAVGGLEVDYFNNEGIVRNTTTQGTIFRDQNYQKFIQNTSHKLLLNLSSNFNKHSVDYNGMYIHTNKQYFGDYIGVEGEAFQDEELGYAGLVRRQQTNDNTLLVNQLTTNWSISDRLNLEVGGAMNLVSGNEPDRRINYLGNNASGNLDLWKGDGRQQRYYSNLNETDFNARVGLSYDLSTDEDKISKVEVGYLGRFVNTSFDAYNYIETVINVVSFPNDEVFLDTYFNQNRLDNGDFRVALYHDFYTVDKYINGGYANFIYQFSPRFIANIGVKADNAYLFVDYNVNRGGTVGDNSDNPIDELYILPNLNLKYDISEKHSLRLGASKTYTLPQSKEVSPFRYIGENFKSEGNPDLRPSENYNVDLKWDYYLSRGELLSLNGFYKYIVDPISRVEKASAGGFLTYDNISDYATVAGVELEFRKNIFESGSTVRNNKLSFGLNASYIYTNINLDIQENFTNSSSQLEGSAPFLFNADLSYNIIRENNSFTATLVGNYFSDRIYTIGTQKYQDIVENGVPTLDAILSAKIAKHWSVGIKARNLLNPQFQLTRKANGAEDLPAIVLSDYKKGSSYSLSVGYKF